MSSTAQWVERLQEEARQRLEAAAELQDRLRTARGTGRSTDRAVTVTVGPSGTLLDIDFADHAERLDRGQLRAAVLEAAGRAQQDVTTSVAALTAGMPGGDAVRDMIAGRVPQTTQDALDAELARRRGEQE